MALFLSVYILYMPTNGIADNILYSINGAPIFTYGMISLTAIVLAYVTFIETPDVPNENPLETESTPIDTSIPNEQPALQQLIPDTPQQMILPVTTETPTPEGSIPNQEVTEPVQAEPTQVEPLQPEEAIQQPPVQEEPLQETVPQEVANQPVTQPTSETPIKQAGKNKQSRKNKANVSKISKRKTRTTHK